METPPTGALESKYAREIEADADLNGLHYMIKAGYDPNGMIHFLNRIQRIKILTIVFGIILIGCFAPPRPSMPRPDPEGFRDIKWGTEISTLKEMEKVEQGKSSGRDLVWYRRKGDTLAIGEAKLENIFYSFWIGNFESVWIDFEGEENFEALKKELFERFGKARGPEGSMDKMGKGAGRERSPTERAGAFYVWWGKNTDIWLSYSKDRHKGTLTMNSRKISEERRDYEKEKEKEKGERLKEKGF